jgi:hypothetical protein
MFEIQSSPNPVNPVALPARLATRSPPTGSVTFTNTIGALRLIWSNASIAFATSPIARKTDGIARLSGCMRTPACLRPGIRLFMSSSRFALIWGKLFQMRRGNRSPCQTSRNLRRRPAKLKALRRLNSPAPMAFAGNDQQAGCTWPFRGKRGRRASVKAKGQRLNVLMLSRGEEAGRPLRPIKNWRPIQKADPVGSFSTPSKLLRSPQKRREHLGRQLS